jgi:hypothetical protein
LEALEGRWAPANVTWSSPTDGAWEDGSNWSTGVPPGAADDVTIAQPGITVTHAVGNDQIRSLTSSGGASQLQITGGRIDVQNQVQVQNTFTLTINNALLGMAAGGTFALTGNGGTVNLGEGGSLIGATSLSFNPGATFNVAGGTLVVPGTLTFNQGTFNFNSGTIDAPLPSAFNVSNGSTFNFNGGSITGSSTVALTGSTLNIGADATQSVTFVMRGANNLTGTVHAGQTVWVQGSNAGEHAVLTIPANLTNDGSLQLESINTNWNSNIAVADQATLTNAADGVIHSNPGTVGGGRSITGGSLRNQGAIDVPMGGTFAFTTGTFEVAGGSFTGSGDWAIYSSQVRVTAASATPLVLRGNNSLLSDNPAGMTLWVQGSNAGGAALLTVPANVTNYGVLRLESIITNWNSGLAITNGATLTNDASGDIRANPGTGGIRTITGNLDNQGILEVTGNVPLTVTGTLNNEGQINNTVGQTAGYVTGTYVAAGGSTQGLFFVFNAQVQVTAAPADRSPIRIAGTSTLVGDNPAGTTLWVQGSSSFASAGILRVAAGASNFGTIRLESIQSNWDTSLEIPTGTFTNAGTIQANPGSNGNRRITGNLTNLDQGLINGNTIALPISGGNYTAAGGSMTGSAYLQGLTFSVTASPSTGQAVVQLQGTCTLVGNNLANTFLDVQAFTNLPARLNVSGGASNAGTIRLFLNANNATSTLVVSGPGAFMNAPGGVIRDDYVAGNGSFAVMGNLLNAGTLTANANLPLSSPGFDYVNTGTIQIANGATLTVTGNSLSNQPGGVVAGDGTLDLSGSGAAPFSNYGTVQVPAGNTLLIKGTFTNFSSLDQRLSGGNYDVTGTLRFDNASIVTLDANLLLDGAGGNGGQVLPPTGTSSALGGLAAITPSGSLTLRNGRVIGTTASPQPSLRNDGLLSVRAGSTFYLGTYSQGAAAELDVNAGRVRIQTSFSNVTGSTLTGGVYRITGPDSSHRGTLQFVGADLATNVATVELNGPFSEIVDTTNPTPLDGLRDFAMNSAGGSFSIQAGRSFTTGDFTNNGTLTVGAGCTFQVGGNLANYSGTTLAGGTWNLAGTLQFTGADIVTNAATILLDGSGGRIQDSSPTPLNGLRDFAVNDVAGVFSLRNSRSFTRSGDFTNNGTLDIGAGTAFNVTGNLTNLVGTTLTGGTWLVSGTFRFTGAIQTNAATLVLDGPGSAITDLQGVNALSGFSSNASSGSFTIRNSRNLTLNGSLANAGVLTVGSGSTLSVVAYTQTAGTTTLAAGGTLTATTGGVSVAQGSTLNGSGAINGDLTNAGVLNVGGVGAIGTWSINGNFTQAATGTLEFEIGGYNPGTDFDQLLISGQATLDGTLHVSLVDPFNPNPGDSFQILSFAGVSGRFATLRLPPGGFVTDPFDGTVNF